MQQGDDKEEGDEQLAGALCALAERLLGDAEQLDTVAAECEQLLQRAQQIFPHSPEPLQVLFGSYRELQHLAQVKFLLPDFQAVHDWSPKALKFVSVLCNFYHS